MRKLLLVLTVSLFLPGYLIAQEEPEKAPGQGEEILKRVESFRKAVSRIRGKEFRGEFKAGVKSREELKSYIIEKTKEPEFVEELEDSTKILAKLGLIKPGFDLKKAVVEMLSEQVAGFYDPEKKELYLLEETLNDPMQEMVMAHEIFHALQDQYFHIDSMMKVIRHDDDRVLAVISIIEGEATLGGLEYMFQKVGASILGLPMDVGESIRGESEKARRNQPDSAMAKAPNFIRETLLFRYSAGSSFVQKVLKKYGSWKALDRLFDNPPLSTEQVMHPEKYLGEVDYPVRIHLPKLHKHIEGGWEEVQTSSMGEFAIKVLLDEFVDEKTAAVAAAGWDGDSYTMIESKEKGGPQIIAWLSVWDSQKDAKEFAEGYTLAVNKRYKAKAQKMDAGYFLRTEDGEETVLIEFAGTQVLVIQGAPASMLPKIRTEILKAKQVEMVEKQFGSLVKHKLELPKPPAKEEAKPPEKEPAKRGF